VDLTHVRTLAEIVRQRGFSRAARVLHRSQPAVSHHIRLLEADLGMPLLERLGKRAFPTRAGAVLLEHARRALDELEAGRQAVEQLRGVVAGRVRLGTGATLATYVLPAVLGALRRRHPALELAVVTGNASEIVAAVADNDLDAGIVTRPARGRHLAVAPYAADPLVAIAAPASAWPRARALHPRELARHPLICYERGGAIRRVIDDWFRRGRATPRIAMELGNAEAIKRLVEVGLGIGVTSAVTVRAEIRAGRLVARPLVPPLSRGLVTVRRRDKAVTPALHALLSALEDARPRAARILALPAQLGRQL
jgi:DNA-binding transcriptional LysR family regulator